MEEPTKEDLDAVFLAAPAAPPKEGGPAAAPMDDMAEMEAALDESIDEAFSAEDPVARREAFKRAIRLCKETDY